MKKLYKIVATLGFLTLLLSQFTPPASAQSNLSFVCLNLSGAIFTTDSTGHRINQNIYARKQDVYLQGGPDQRGVHLPDGRYYYRVTDPSGKVVLSATRTVNVVNNVF